MAASRSLALRLGLAAILLALIAIGAGAAILFGHANPIIVCAAAGTVLVAMILGVLRPKWAARAESLWIPTDPVGLVLWLFSGGTPRKDADWERAAAERRERIARAQAAEADTNSTKVRCLHCQHVQTVPVSQPTFVCEQCKAHI
jgi:ribosomal protein S27E